MTTPVLNALARENDELRTRLAKAEAALRDLHNEVDCRIEHGAESGGHLEYVRTRLAALTEERWTQEELDANLAEAKARAKKFGWHDDKDTP